ncbi:hypothetical protein C0992_006628 [Termitomyces sp. T32_za158]|nr:hypothetical protein C0992_006628 [Termitomyces sp. T32_za158]
MANFDDFVITQPTAAFSAQYFNSVVTFQHVLDLDYPRIALYPSLVSFVFEQDILMDAPATVIIPGEVIPHIRDILDISKDMQAAFMQGKRSVCVCFRVQSEEIYRRYHFSKILLFKLINNKKNAMAAAQRLAAHVSSLPAIPHSVRDYFLTQRVFAPFKGFYSTDFPLWKLSDLLDEAWIEEDIMNSLAELSYFMRAVLQEPNVTPRIRNLDRAMHQNTNRDTVT